MDVMSEISQSSADLATFQTAEIGLDIVVLTFSVCAPVWSVNGGYLVFSNFLNTLSHSQNARNPSGIRHAAYLIMSIIYYYVSHGKAHSSHV